MLLYSKITQQKCPYNLSNPLLISSLPSGTGESVGFQSQTSKNQLSHQAHPPHTTLSSSFLSIQNIPTQNHCSYHFLQLAYPSFIFPLIILNLHCRGTLGTRAPLSLGYCGGHHHPLQAVGHLLCDRAGRHTRGPMNPTDGSCVDQRVLQQSHH